MLSFVKYLAQGKNRLNEDIFYVEKEAEKMDIEVAFLYVDDTRVHEMSFANNIYTPEGGMHLTGFRSALDAHAQQLCARGRMAQGERGESDER